MSKKQIQFGVEMNVSAIVFGSDQRLSVSDVELTPPSEEDVVVDVRWSGISTGTEKLLWTGQMPPFPGLGYPLVPGYEAVGTIAEAPKESGYRPGELVFAPGAQCFKDVRGLFGGASSRLVTNPDRIMALDSSLGEQGVLLALAATAHHILTPIGKRARAPELIIGHGTLGRLVARMAIALGFPPPLVWEKNSRRISGAEGYDVISAENDPKRDYRSIIDVSGDASLLDIMIDRLTRGGEIVLAGFYQDRPSFAFPSAFIREAQIRISAEFHPGDMIAARELIDSGALALDGLITHQEPASNANEAYSTAFTDSDCLKMVLDWKD
tara:strand:+ start:817 stop:1791 length:975 start_codon:yes stop_codon:yes gene_type:complete